MTPEQWEEVDRVWHAVLARPEHERDAALAELCAGDEALRREVESLLANLARASSAGFGAPLAEPEPARLAPGTRLGPYEIIAAIGAGGMGEVYRARDTRLGRDVAVKVLPFDAANNPDRLRRFSEEARAAAALNHPNILAVYDVGSQPLARPSGAGEVVEIAFIVTELLEGRTLREALGDEAMTPVRAISIASQVADGLAAAHARGIVHRDLKPENLFVTADGHAKILDFGLAKAMADTPAAVQARTKTGTAPDVVLGTPGYMAPEQLRGQAIDHRADVFAFGAVLYEMLTGRRAFGGDTPVDAMGAVLRETPSTAVSTPERPIPTALVRIVERCLEKTPASRFQSTNDLAFALKSLTMADTPAPAPMPTPRARRPVVSWLPWAAALALAIALVMVWRPGRSGAAEPSQLVQFEISETLEVAFGVTMAAPTPAISPDGTQIAFMGVDPSGAIRLWIRSLESLAARPLRDTEASAPQALPFWSWDGREVAFNTPGDLNLKDAKRRPGRLKAVDVATGRVRTICETDSSLFLGGSWGPDDTILFVTRDTPEVQRVSASGGTPVAASKLDPGHAEGHHRFPSFLPDGRHFVFQTNSRNSETGMMAIGSLDRLEHTLLVETDSRIIFAPPGYMLYLREGALVAHPFDANTRSFTGDPIRLVDNIRRHEDSGRAAFTASRNGTLVYRVDDQAGQTPMVWVNRKDGSVEPVPIEPGYWVGFELFDQGRRLLTHLHTQETTGGLWILDLDNKKKKQVMTGGGGHDSHHRVSPDGSQFAWIRTGFNSIFRRRVDGIGEEERFDIRQATLNALDDYSKNWLIATVTAEGAGRPAAIWYAEAANPQNMKPYFSSSFAQGGARLSPDEKWLAFYSRDPGMPGIHIRPFPNAKDGFWVVQGSQGAGELRWRAGGKELFFVSPPGVDRQQRIMSVSVTTRGKGLELGAPEARKLPPVNLNRGFDVSPDGQRFLLNLLPTATAPAAGTSTDRSFGALNVVLNWPLLLQRK